MTLSLAVSSPSFAVSVSTYVPTVEKVAVVIGAAGLAKVTVPGPLVLLHSELRAVPVSTPSSTTLPVSAAVGNAAKLSNPASTEGAVLTTLKRSGVVTQFVAVVMDGTTAVTSGMCPLVSITRPQHSLKPQRPSSPGAVGISRPVPARICCADRA